MQTKVVCRYIFLALFYSVAQGVPVLSRLDMMPHRFPSTLDFTKPLVNSSRIFASQILNNLAQEEGKNVFFSPYSISTLIAILRLAASGNTRKEIENTSLFRDLDLDSVDEQFRTLSESIFDFENLSTASQIIVDKKVWDMVYYDFFLATRDYHFAELNKCDFKNHPQACLNTINHLVDNQTKGQIQDFLTSDDVTINTKVLLMNVLQLNAIWNDPFMTSKTRSESFELVDGSIIQVPMMHQLAKYRHRVARDDRAIPEIIEIPFKNVFYGVQKFCKNNLVILISNRFISLEQIQQNFADEIDVWRESTEYGPVNLSLPKFQMNYKIDLERSLRKLGITEAFDGATADFSSMMNLQAPLSKSLHEATISFEETGVRAAAVSFSSFIFRMNNLAPDVRVNRPFIFFVEDCHTGALLFLGRVDDPR